jgi:hypothetical protein
MTASTTVTREQLYEEVWTTPTVVLSEKYGVSDVALGKICRRLNVPKPGLGYWARVDAGQKPERTPLPKRSLQQAYEIRPRPVEPPETAEQLQARRAHEDLVAKFAVVQVPEVVDRPHKLTRRTEQHFKEIAKRIREASRVRRFDRPQIVSMPYSDNGRYRCSSEEGFPLVVSMENLDRALRLLDTWAKELERLDFVLGLDREKRLEARKDGEAFRFHLREGYTKREFAAEEQKARKEKHEYPHDWEWIGSNKFMFALEGDEWGTRKEWADRAQILETKLPEMLATMVELVPLQKSAREQRLEEERIRAEAERRRWKEQERREQEKRQLDNLVKAEAEIAKSQAALRFLDRLEAELRAGGAEIPEAAAEWIAQARAVAERSNPMPEWVAELRQLKDEDAREPGSRAYDEDPE